MKHIHQLSQPKQPGKAAPAPAPVKMKPAKPVKVKPF